MFDERKIQSKNGASGTISIGNWMALDCINFLNIIPIIGSIVALVLYLVIAFSQNTAPSMRNRVLASFVWLLVWIVAAVVFLFFFGGLAVMSDFINQLPSTITSTSSV